MLGVSTVSQDDHYDGAEEECRRRALQYRRLPGTMQKLARSPGFLC